MTPLARRSVAASMSPHWSRNSSLHDNFQNRPFSGTPAAEQETPFTFRSTSQQQQLQQQQPVISPAPIQSATPRAAFQPAVRSPQDGYQTKPTARAYPTKISNDPTLAPRRQLSSVVAGSSADFADLASRESAQRLTTCAYAILQFTYAYFLWFSLSWKSLSILGFLKAPFSINTIISAAVMSITLILSLYVRNTFLQVSQPIQPNLFGSLSRTMIDPVFWISTALYTASAVATGIFDLETKSDRFDARVFLYPDGRYGDPQLNENVVFLILFNGILGASYSVSRTYYGRDNLVFPILRRSWSILLKGRLPTLALRSLRFATRVFGFTWVGYLFFGGVAFGWAHSLTALITRLTDDPVLRIYMFDFGLMVHCILRGVLFVMCWETMNNTFEVIYSQALGVTRSKLFGLVSELKTPSHPYNQALAFLELNTLCQLGTPEILTDVFRPSDDEDQLPSYWHQISSACLEVVDDLRFRIDKDYSVVGPGGLTQAGVPAYQKPESVIKKKKTSPVNRSIIAPRRPSLLDWLFLGRTSARNSRSRGAGSGSNFDDNATAVPALLRLRRNTDVGEIGTGHEGAGEPEQVPFIDSLELLKRANRFLVETPGTRWMFADSVQRRTSAVFESLQIQVWAVRSLAGLVVTSATMDSHGLVHRDVALILETLIRCLVEVERYSSRPPVRFYANAVLDPMGSKGVYRPPLGLVSQDGEGSSVEAWGHHQLLQWPCDTMISVLQTAIYQIVTTFYENLTLFEFPPDVAAMLKSFVEFEE
ncbi:nucleoporin protein Ndc1-Nup [Cladochytrium replicatum]|nr:nucleoporin protein Ndc1-Nup [Cladochytrium replicatum]